MRERQHALQCSSWLICCLLRSATLYLYLPAFQQSAAIEEISDFSIIEVNGSIRAVPYSFVLIKNQISGKFWTYICLLRKNYFLFLPCNLTHSPLFSTAVVKVVDRQQNVARTICFLKRGDSFGVSRQ